MKPHFALFTLTLAAVAAATLSTASLAQDGPRHGPMRAFDFDAIDADKNGAVTQAELDAYRAAEAKATDTNADGKLDAAELAAMHVARVTAEADAMAAKMIARLDTDGDAALSAAELAARPMPAMLFDRMDADSDGAITKAEAEAARAEFAERRGHHGRHRGGMFGWGDN